MIAAVRRVSWNEMGFGWACYMDKGGEWFEFVFAVGCDILLTWQLCPRLACDIGYGRRNGRRALCEFQLFGLMIMTQTDVTNARTMALDENTNATLANVTNQMAAISVIPETY